MVFRPQFVNISFFRRDPRARRFLHVTIHLRAGRGFPTVILRPQKRSAPLKRPVK